MNPVILFPGQGAQTVGMGTELYRTYPAVREVFELASDLSGMDMAALCFKGPRAALIATKNTQPAIYTLSFAVYRVLAEHGITPQYFAGHSLGELTAMTAAGCMNFAQGLLLVLARANLMAAAFDQQEMAMAAVGGATSNEIQGWIDAINAPVWIANLNAPTQTVVSGTAAALNLLADQAHAAGAKIARLHVSGAFHTPLLSEAGTAFARLIDETELRAPSHPLIGNVSAAPLTTADEIHAELTAQMCSPVQWTRSMQYILARGGALFIEVGPGKVLKGLMLRNTRDALCLSTETPRDIEALLQQRLEVV